MKKLIAIVAFTAFLSGCQSMTQDEPAAVAAVSCVFQSDKAAKVFEDYNGRQVGFCCKNCAAKWAKLNPAKKDALFASSGQ